MSEAPKGETDRKSLQRELDFELEGTFPASDPPKITRTSLTSQITPVQHRDDAGAKGTFVEFLAL